MHTRNVALDSFKGFFLIIMAINHFGGHITVVTWETFGFVTMAEGFVFISGYVFSYVNFRHRNDFDRIRRRSHKRAGQLMLWQIGMLVLVASLIVIGEKWDVETWVGYSKGFQIRPVVMFVLAVFHIYWPYHYCDVLPLYFYLLLVAPFYFKNLLKGKWLLVLGVSLLSWGLAQANLGLPFSNKLPEKLVVDKGNLDFFSWQLLFLGGMICGLWVRQGRDQIFHQKRILYLSIVLVVLGFLFRRHMIPGNINMIHLLTERRTLAIGRVVNFAALAYVVAWLLRRWPFMNNRWLAYLGRHSLLVFVYHAAVLHLLLPLRWKYVPMYSALEWGVLILFVVSLTLPAWLAEVFKQNRARHRLVSGE